MKLIIDNRAKDLTDGDSLRLVLSFTFLSRTRETWRGLQHYNRKIGGFTIESFKNKNSERFVITKT